MPAGGSGNIVGLPYEAVNQLLSLDLAHGVVHLSEQAIHHMQVRHPEDFSLCITHVRSVLRTPEYIGQAPHHARNFEVVKQVEGRWVLIAVSSDANEYGVYPIESAYTIPESARQRRVRKQHLYPLE